MSNALRTSRGGAPFGRLLALSLAGIFLLGVIFAVTGVLLTIGIFLLPLLIGASILYLAWNARRNAPRR